MAPHCAPPHRASHTATTLHMPKPTFAPRATKARVDDHIPLTMLCQRPVTPPTGAAAFEARCANCARPLLVDGAGLVCRDGSKLYCGRNCFWSVVCDPGGARLKVAARRERCGKPKVRRRRRKDLLEVEDKDSVAKKEDEEEDEDWVHAMFSLHQAMSGDAGSAIGGRGGRPGLGDAGRNRWLSKRGVASKEGGQGPPRVGKVRGGRG